ncbi:nucleoside phosphorylase [Deltaproteobacteria bacterium OttesenSCG-928-K17]|nr:nucleoside phosphorylase [Deltaproteobacteria bacterium OttesenSCG-928-K17]
MNPDQEVAFTSSRRFTTVPPRGILAAAGFDLKLIKRLAPQDGMEPSPLLGGLTRLSIWPETFLAGPVLGAPMAVMAMEELIRRGATEIIFVGLAGSLVPGLAPGDLMAPYAGLSTEGTSQHYPADLLPDHDLRAKIVAAGGVDSPIAGGTIWSTDGIYRETAGLINRQKNAGALAVDMETTGLWAAARFREIQLATLVVISDVLDETDHRTGFHLPQFRQGLIRAADTAWRVVSPERRRQSAEATGAARIKPPAAAQSRPAPDSTLRAGEASPDTAGASSGASGAGLIRRITIDESQTAGVAALTPPRLDDAATQIESDLNRADGKGPASPLTLKSDPQK